ncbi:MAG: DUF2341 domain-containing protein [Deltaproteobacteria bacterium]|nr:DUF2341 domain-containing protein [Deltaproteobacteria bacterium]
MKYATRICIIGLLASAWLLLCATPALAWWNDKWQYRKKITFDTSLAGADIKENLTDAPVLIRLHAGNFNFGNAKQDGSDIRFVQNDDKTQLKHHIERFDPLDGMALLWVKVPQLAGGSNTNAIYMYYGNQAAMGGQDPGATYDVNYAGIYHVAEMQGPPKDTTNYGNHAAEFTGGQGLPSLIGNGITLTGAGSRMVLPKSPSINLSEGFTLSTWIKLAEPQNDAYLFSMQGQGETPALVVAIRGTKVVCTLAAGEGQAVTTEEVVDLPLNTWRHLSVTGEPRKRVAIFQDGLEMTWKQITGPLPKLDVSLIIGGSADGQHPLVGDLDEIRISKSIRNVGLIRLGFKSEGPDGNFSVYGNEEAGETSGGLPIFYLKTIVKNISLDGWVIIGLLVLFSGFSWLIFFTKTFTFILIGRENRAFAGAFAESGDLFAVENEEMENSSLFRSYMAGLGAIRDRMGNPGHEEGKRLSPRDMSAVRAALDRTYVEETQRLNAWLVVLTMAIAGGPFLGLLGTVWGVMNTFAAMAEAGEANIMAIAPGVASALSTTVFGLIVAIPALFAYNYLTSRIRGFIAELTVFMDQFLFKVEESLGGEE